MNKILIITIGVAMLSSCSHHRPTDLSESKKTTTAPPATVRVIRDTLRSAIRLPGELKPYEKVDIYPKMNGFVKEMYVDRGSHVGKGDLLMTLEAPEIAQQIQAAQGRLLQAQEKLNASRDRYFRLRSAASVAGSVSELDLMNAGSRYQADSALEQSERANLNAARVLQDYLAIRAPFEGVITERNVHPGSLTGPNFKMDSKPLLILEQNSKLRLELFIPEVYTGSIDTKQHQVSFTTPSLPGQKFTASISRASGSLYDQYRSEAVEADVPNPDGIFKPGMYVEVSLPIHSSVASYLVPSTAIVTTTEGKYIISTQGGTAHFIKVREGIADKGKTEVFGDLHGDETVLQNPSEEIKEGEAVE
ncbi:MAG: efflux RND transporter periplasmic adaptor subunit [Bacteroidetes bacterium]|nr:efflux RND transporter periplasmic adaptor subunit [Bacteroidota bacterium]